LGNIDEPKSNKTWLPEGIIDTGMVNVQGHKVRMHEDMYPIYMDAIDILSKEGIDLQIQDSFRYSGVQQEQYDASIGTAKEGLVTTPDKSYHVKGKAFDLAQNPEMRDNERISEVLSSLGLIRSRDDEWWHWSTQD